jgi:fructose-1,6-bisphosphatase/inositol monophosphatase family enzyme
MSKSPVHIAGSWSDDDLFDLFDSIANVCASAVLATSDRRQKGNRPTQYGLDLNADDAALALLDAAGVGVLSEESGIRRAESEIMVIIDPVDGSTNASRNLPWYATSLCALDTQGARLSLVRNLATGTTYRAVRGGGATRDFEPIAPAKTTTIDDAVISLSGYPPAHLGWRQFRTMGAAALDLCAVADGTFDGFLDCSFDAHGIWDYAGAALVCSEVGVPIADARGRDLWVRDHAMRRTPVAGATQDLFDALMVARLAF